MYSCLMAFRLAHVSDLHLRGTDADEDFLRGMFRSFEEYGVHHVVVTGGCRSDRDGAFAGIKRIARSFAAA